MLHFGLSAILTVLPDTVYDLAKCSIFESQEVCKIVIFVQLRGTEEALGIH